MGYANVLLTKRQSVIQAWSDDDKRATLASSIGIGFAVASVGRVTAMGFFASRREIIGYFGDGRGHASIGRSVNAAMWAAGGTALYYSVVAAIARSNEKIEPAYSVPPDNDFVSAGPRSLSPFDELGLTGSDRGDARRAGHRTSDSGIRGRQQRTSLSVSSVRNDA
jgi:hypothetical protein